MDNIFEPQIGIQAEPMLVDALLGWLSWSDKFRLGLEQNGADPGSETGGHPASEKVGHSVPVKPEEMDLVHFLLGLLGTDARLRRWLSGSIPPASEPMTSSGDMSAPAAQSPGFAERNSGGLLR